MADLTQSIPESDTKVIELVYNGEVFTNDDGTPMTIEVYLPHSKEYRKARHAQADVLIEQEKRRLKSAEAEELGVELLANTTKGWDITLGGKKPKLTTAKAKEVYETFTWVAEQVVEAQEKSRAFTKA